MSTALSRTQGGPIRGTTGVAGALPFGPSARWWPLLHALGENRNALGLARRVLQAGVCDGCGVGSIGLHDELGLHLCPPRLHRLAAHTGSHFVPADVLDLDRLRGMDDAAIQALGRVPYPFVWRAGERGLSRVGWDVALASIRAAWGPSTWRVDPQGLSRQDLYAVARAAHAVTTDIDLSTDRHAPWLQVLRDALGTTQPTASPADLASADLILLWGSNLAETQPTVCSWLARAKARGARVVSINAVVEPGLERTWGLKPFGHRLADDRICVRPGADARLLGELLGQLVDLGAVADLSATTTGLPERTDLASGVPQRDVDWLATLIARSDRLVSLFGGGLGRSAAGVQGLVNLHLSRDAVGRAGCGIVPLVGGAGLRDALDMGLGQGLLPGEVPRDSARIRHTWGTVSDAPGGDVQVVFGAATPGPSRVRVVVDTHLRSAALTAVDELLVVLPATTRSEHDGSTTSVFGTARRAEAALPPLAEAWAPGRVAAALTQQTWTPESIDAEVDAIAPRPDPACVDGNYALPGGLAVLAPADEPPAEGFVAIARHGIGPATVWLGSADAARLQIDEHTRVHLVSAIGRVPCGVRIGELPAGVVQVDHEHERQLLGAERWAAVRVEVA